MTVVERPSAAADQQSEFEQLAAEVDEAVVALDQLDIDAAEQAKALADAVEAFHRPGLVAIVKKLKADPRGKELLFELVDDPSVRALFAMHSIIKADPMARANQALLSVRPYLQSHGGDVELVKIEDGAAFVRLQGSCNGCSMSAVTLREGVEEALVQLDEVDRIEVLEDEPTPAFIPLSSVGRRTKEEAGWVPGPSASDIGVGELVRFDLSNDDSFVITNVDNRIAVFRNACIHQGLSLDGGMIEDGVIRCPWHGFTFEASSGECLSAPGAQLEQMPTRIEDGTIWIRAHG